MVKTMHHGTTTVAFRTSSTGETVSLNPERRAETSSYPYGMGHHNLALQVSLLFGWYVELLLTEEREDPTK